MKTLSYGIIYKGKTRFTYQAMRGADKSATLEVMGLLVSYEANHRYDLRFQYLPRLNGKAGAGQVRT